MDIVNLSDLQSDQTLERTRSLLEKLALSPPQVLLLDGGLEEQRLALAYYWAACAICANPQISQDQRKPCLHCQECQHIEQKDLRDLLIFDGRISNKEDEDNQGQIRAMSIENIRNLKGSLRDKPSSNLRVVILMGISESRTSSANALLKVLEEPTPYTIFVILAAQREQILPTLVSRSFCLTLPWPMPFKPNSEMLQWLTLLGNFWQNGKGLLQHTSTKNAIDTKTAEYLLVELQKALIRSQILQNEGQNNAIIQNIKTNLVIDQIFSKLKPEQLFSLNIMIEQAQEKLRLAVNPTHTLEALATNIYCLILGV